MKRTLLVAAAMLAALALTACQKNDSSTPKTGATPPASSASPSPSSPSSSSPSSSSPSSDASPATPSDASKDAGKK
jgi:hypothetical protein